MEETRERVVRRREWKVLHHPEKKNMVKWTPVVEW